MNQQKLRLMVRENRTELPVILDFYYVYELNNNFIVYANQAISKNNDTENIDETASSLI